MLFSIEQSRIDYIRDHCKSTTFNIIKTRCLDKINPYIIVKKILEDLDNIYDEFDAYGKADMKLYNPDFDMQKNEIFNVFLTRYTAIIALL